MRFTTGDVALATGGRLVGNDVTVVGVSIDSRTIAAGELFVPIVGARDGHDFVDPASMTAYLTAREPIGGNAVVVADTGEALLAIGRQARDRLGERVVGITGSVGKTSVKDLAMAILARRYATAASPGNFNNELGVPLTLANAPDGTEVAVIELGARGLGHIRLLCDVARPVVGVVTAIGSVHTELFGTIDDVARGKRELVESLPPSGVAVLNADDARVAAMAASSAARVVTYGTAADVHATGVHVDAELRPSFTLRSPWGTAPVRLSVRGAHQVHNGLAAAAASLAVGATIDDVVAGLARAVLSPWRMEVGRARSGALIVNDAYNASPLSMAAALESLALVDATRRTAFVGTMAELGEIADDAHAEVTALATSLGIGVVAVGEPRYRAATEVATIEEALALTQADLGAGDAVLVKGSRVAGLERLAHRLLDR